MPTITGYISVSNVNDGVSVPGSSTRIAYATAIGIIFPSGSASTTGNTSYPGVNDFGVGWASNWQGTVPTPVAGAAIYLTNGIYDPLSNITTWQTPYLATFKVGQLDALAVYTGSITVSSSDGKSGYIIAGNPVINTAGNGIASGAGALMTYQGGAAFGNTTTNLVINPANGTLALNGNIVGTSNINNNAVTASTSAASNSVTLYVQAGYPVFIFTQCSGGSGVNGYPQNYSVGFAVSGANKVGNTTVAYLGVATNGVNGSWTTGGSVGVSYTPANTGSTSFTFSPQYGSASPSFAIQTIR